MSQPPGPQGPYPHGPYPPHPPGPPPGYPPAGPNPYGGGQKKSPLPWILGGIGALVVIAGAVVAIVLLTGDDEGDDEGDGGGTADMSTPRAVADAIASAMNAKSVDGLLALTCSEFGGYIGGNNKADLQEDLNEVSNVSVVRVQEQGPDAAEAKLSFTEQGEAQPDDQEFQLARRDGKWTWCEKVPESAGDPGSTPGGQPPTFSQGPPTTGPN